MEHIAAFIEHSAHRICTYFTINKTQSCTQHKSRFPLAQSLEMCVCVCVCVCLAGSQSVCGNEINDIITHITTTRGPNQHHLIFGKRWQKQKHRLTTVISQGACSTNRQNSESQIHLT